MARIVGGIGTSHIPAIGIAMAKNQCEDPYWRPFFQAYGPVRNWLDAVQPTVAVVVYNDHGLNFFLDKMPAFAIGAAPEYRNADEGWGLPTLTPFPGDSDGRRPAVELRLHPQRRRKLVARTGGKCPALSRAGQEVNRSALEARDFAVFAEEARVSNQRGAAAGVLARQLRAQGVHQTRERWRAGSGGPHEERQHVPHSHA